MRQRTSATILCFLALSAAILPAQQGKPAWKQLYNGKDLTGWQHVGKGQMTIENALIATHGGMGLLWWTGQRFGNCVIRVVYKTKDKADNSGIFIRIPIKPDR